MGTNPFETLEMKLAPANSIRGALFRLRNTVDAIAGHDISYEYMLRKTSYVRADLINMTTLSSNYTDLYLPSGGTNSDPVIENAGNMTEPLYVDLNAICYEPGTRFYKNKFFLKLVREGCPYLSAFPFSDSLTRGYGVFTIFDSRPPEDVKLYADELMQLGAEFHAAIKTQGQFLRHFGLTDKELRALEHMALGHATADIAVTEGISRRTVELRLENVRKKLRATNSTEAVYKGVSYGIINPE